MAHQLAHFDIYREELAKAYPGFGYALWEPGPGEQNPHVEVGDVGFVREGQFNRLFNALLPGEHESHGRFRVGVPEGHEPLRLTVADHINRRDLTPNTFHSHGVSVQSGGLQVLAATTVGSAEVSFSCTRKHGAALSLPVSARCENTLTLGHFRKWMIKHIDSWLAFTHMHGLGLEMEDIVLVMGCHRTRSWSNIAFNEFRKDAQFSLGVEVAGSFGASINWRASSLRVQGAVLSQGPSGENLPENQCIFIRGFRVKRLLWGLFPRIEAAAEPKPDPPADDREPEREVVSMPSVTEYRDPLHVLLEHIAKRMPDCHMALVHDDDLERILKVDDGSSLETLQPDVVMNHLERSQLEIRVTSDPLPSDDRSPRIDTGHVRVAMLSEHLKDHASSVASHSHGRYEIPQSHSEEMHTRRTNSARNAWSAGSAGSARSDTTLVRDTTPTGDSDPAKQLGPPLPFEPATAEVTGPMKRKRISVVSESVDQPARKRKTTSTVAQTLLSLAPLPEPVTSEKEEAQAAQSTSTTLEPKHVPAVSIEELTITLKEQNKIIEQLVQDNILLRDEINNLSESSKRVENTIPTLAVELNTKFEKMLEKTEDRIQAPIDRLLEVLGRIRNTQSVPDSRAQGEGSVGPSGRVVSRGRIYGEKPHNPLHSPPKWWSISTLAGAPLEQTSTPTPYYPDLDLALALGSAPAPAPAPAPVPSPPLLSFNDDLYPSQELPPLLSRPSHASSHPYPQSQEPLSPDASPMMPPPSPPQSSPRPAHKSPNRAPRP